MWWNGVGKNRKTDEEHDYHCVEKGFQLARVEIDRDSKGEREALEIGYCTINTWKRLELKLTWSRETVHILKTVF